MYLSHHQSCLVMPCRLSFACSHLHDRVSLRVMSHFHDRSIDLCVFLCASHLLRSQSPWSSFFACHVSRRLSYLILSYRDRFLAIVGLTNDGIIRGRRGLRTPVPARGPLLQEAPQGVRGGGGDRQVGRRQSAALARGCSPDPQQDGGEAGGGGVRQTGRECGARRNSDVYERLCTSRAKDVCHGQEMCACKPYL